MFSLFQDCLSLTFLPDISKWNNYDEDDINEKIDYEQLNKFDNLNMDNVFPSVTIQDDKILNDIDLFVQLQTEKYY